MSDRTADATKPRLESVAPNYIQFAPQIPNTITNGVENSWPSWATPVSIGVAILWILQMVMSMLIRLGEKSPNARPGRISRQR